MSAKLTQDACTQAFKMFTSGSGGGGGGGSGQLVSLAMGEASKLFDSSGGSSSGGKQEVVNGAAMTMMKLVVKVRNSSRIHVQCKVELFVRS